MMNLDNYFALYANCILVKGASRSLICDVQLGRYHFIPNDLFEILQPRNPQTLRNLLRNYDFEDQQTIYEYFQFLINEEYIHFCLFEELALFPPLSLDWDSPSLVTNSIVDVGLTSNHDYHSIFRELETLGCTDLQLRFYRKADLEELSQILTLLDKSPIKSVEIFVVFDESFQEKQIKQLTGFLRINLLVFHSAPFFKKHTPSDSLPCTIVYTNEIVDNSMHCGFVSPSYFTLNVETFTESQLHNSCLNRKISIDEFGEIKNCPAMTKSFGNVSNTTLSNVLQNDEEFTRLWKITKDQVSVCKDCEFRYICTDCRAFTFGGQLYGKPSKCSYDPYSNEWEKQ